MVEVKTVDLVPRGVFLPHDRVGCVVAQPFPQLTAVEPFRCDGAHATAQLAVVTRTLDLAEQRPHGLAKTHFTIFPEYSVPGKAGVDLIQQRVSANTWPLGTVIIAGIDGLEKDTYAEIAGAPLTHVEEDSSDPASVPDGEWVNCAIIWIKDGNGVVERWIQPKLDRAKSEANAQYQQLFTGKTIYVFSGLFTGDGAPFKFSALVCFDWIATLGGQCAVDRLLENMRAQATAAGSMLPITWMFVLQRNEQPSHHLFLQQVSHFFDRTFCQNVLREFACVVFANNAGLAKPGVAQHYGGTSVVYAHKNHFIAADAPPTVSKGGERFRGSKLLQTHADVFFRERGGCIHSFALTNPAGVGPAANGQLQAVTEAHVYPLTGNTEPRAPGGPVPASVKWVNDELDSLPPLPGYLAGIPLAPNLPPVLNASVASLRALKGQDADRTIQVAKEGQHKSADEWLGVERDAFHHVAHTVNLVGTASTFSEVGKGSGHATVTLGGMTLNLAAVRGKSHESCFDHAQSQCDTTARQLLLVSRDLDNTPLFRNGSFLESSAKELGAEPLFTEPASGIAHIGYADLTRIMLNAANEQAVADGINAQLSAA